MAVPEASLLTAVPETSTWAMMLIGFVGLGYVGYRRARKGSAAQVTAFRIAASSKKFMRSVNRITHLYCPAGAQPVVGQFECATSVSASLGLGLCG